MKPDESVDDVLEELRDSGYQLTPQRQNVIRQCFEQNGHFTAEDLFNVNTDSSQQEFSRATVYNTLQVLVEVGFLRELSDMGDSSYYEINQELHPHAYCKSCGELIDIPVNLEREVHNWDVPFEVDSVRMTLDGYCEECAETASSR
ncbi:MAG: Fur family transcriptional regulator [bacterium]